MALSFEDRQQQWRGGLREFRQHHGRGERATVWQIWIVGDRVFTRWGLKDGQMQETNFQGKVKNVGKKNEISKELDAIAEARRECRKKWDFEGYDEYVGGQNVDQRNTDINILHMLTHLPGSFCLYKPENNFYDQKKLLAKARQGKGNVYYTLKRDGVAKLIVVDYYGNIQMYSRRARAYQDKEGPKELPDGTLDYSTVIPWAARFPYLIEAVRALALPRGTMISCELVHPEKDNYPYISGLTKGYKDRAIEDMAKGGYPILYWWDTPFYEGVDLTATCSFKERFNKIKQHYLQLSGPFWPYIQPLQMCDFDSPEEAEEYAKQMGFEGWVVVDPDAVYGNKGWNLKGKPDRPTTCAKLKATGEDDFVALWDPDDGKGEWGTGDNERGKQVKLPDGRIVEHGGVGSVALYQYNRAGELIFISKCSSGFPFETQSQLRKENFPLVCQCEYKGRTYISDGEKTNALRFPTFVRIRTDKAAVECVNDRL